MTKRISNVIKRRALADYHAGAKQADVARKYKISTSLMSNIVAGAPPKNVVNIQELVRINDELSVQPREYVDAVINIADQKLKDLQYFRKASLIVSQAALERVQADPDMDMADIEKAQNVISKAKETVIGKTPDTAVQVNTGAVTYKWADTDE